MRVSVDPKYSWIDGFDGAGTVTAVVGQTARVRLDNGKLREFPVGDLKPGAPKTDLPSAPKAVTQLAPTHVSEPELPSIPVAPAKHRIPMEFKETPVGQVPAYAADERYYFQQKVDGIRGQLVLDGGAKPWFRSKKGDQLQSSTAAAISGPLLAKLGAGTPAGSPSVTIDGEMLDGKWYVFDMTVEGQNLPWEKRMDMAEAWVKSMNDQGISQIVALPTARTKEEKLALFNAVRDNGGEGVMIKRRDAKYKWGQRTDEILKAKITASADVVVMQRNEGGKDNAVVGVYKNGKLTRVANVSTIGKGNPQVGDVLEVEYLWAHPSSGLLTQARIKKPRPDKDPLMTTDSQFRFVNKGVIDLPSAATVTDATAVSTKIGTDIKPKAANPSLDAMPYPLGGVQDIRTYEAKSKGLDDVIGQQKVRLNPIYKRMESDGAFRARVEEYTSQLRDMASGQTYVAVPIERIDAILAEGRLRTVHEKVISTGGGDGAKNAPGYITARREYENAIMGVNNGKSVKPALRPVYGYIGPSPGHSGYDGFDKPEVRELGATLVTSYGDIHLELKPNVAGRTTVTFDDSLNGGALPVYLRDVQDQTRVSNERLLQAATPSDLYWEALGDPQTYFANNTRPQTQYVEAQIHGGVSMADVARIHVDVNGSNVRSARESLAEIQALWDAADPATRSQPYEVKPGYKGSSLDKQLESKKKWLAAAEQTYTERVALADRLREQGFDVALSDPPEALGPGASAVG